MKTGRLLVITAMGIGMAAALLWLLGMPQQPIRASDLTVCPAGPSACGYATIQAAVDAAQPGDWVKVAAGTYTDLHARPAPPGYVGPAVITQVVHITKSLTLAGGYTTTNWTTSDPDANPTTIDAGGGGRGILIGDAVTVTVQGLRITGGDSTDLGGSRYARDPGGGIYIAADVTAIRDSQVFSNVADVAAGLYIEGGKTTLLLDNDIYANTAALGGGIVSLEGGALTISSNAIYSNTATEDDGGGIFAIGGTFTVTANAVHSNTARWGGGGLYLINADARLSANNIVGNGVILNGGGIYCTGGTTQLSGDTIRANRAQAGAGLYLEDGTALVQASTVVSNDGPGLELRTLAATVVSNTLAANRGPGLNLGDCTATVTGNEVFGNTSPEPGGGIVAVRGTVTLTANSVFSNVTGGDGGGLQLFGTDAMLVANTILSNTAGMGGGGIMVFDSVARLDGDTLRANIAVEDGGGLMAYGSEVAIDAGIVTSNTAGGRGGGLALVHSNQPSLADGPAWLTNTVICDNHAGSQGAGAYLSGLEGNGDFHMPHTTIARNTGGEGSGLYFVGGNQTTYLTNTIIASQTVGIYAGGLDTVTLDGVLWYGNGTNTWGSGQITVSHELAGSPVFRADGYHLGMGSAARNAGLGVGVTVDVDGQARDAQPDLGADEYAPLPLERVTVSGPISGVVTGTYTFTASVVPTETAWPLTYTWKATGHASVMHLEEGITDSLALVWDVEGVKWITVTASNAAGASVTGTHVLTLEAVIPPCIALADVSLTGPLTGVMGTAYTYTAATLPPSATLSLTYTWKATDHVSVTHDGVGIQRHVTPHLGQLWPQRDHCHSS